MNTVQIIILILSIANQILKLVNDNAEDKKDVCNKLKVIRDGAKESTHEGNTRKMEKAFRDVGISHDNDSVRDK